MTRERIAGVCFLLVTTSGVATAQQRAAATGQVPQSPAARVVESAYPSGGSTASRRVQTRSASDRREIVRETVEMPGVDGRLETIQETTTETTRTGPNIVTTRHDVFGFDAQRRRTLLETTQAEQNTRGEGNISTVRNTWAVDSDGHLGLKSRHIEETRSIPPNQQRSTTLLLPGINENLEESERTEYSQRRINPALVRHDSTLMIRDLNGRWQSAETRTADVRDTGPTERIEEETIQRRDVNGNLTVSEKVITRRSEANGREDVVVETYDQYADGFVRPDNRLGLSRRVRSSTTGTADGGRFTVEELEERSLVAPAEPLRVIRRAEVRVRKVGADRWVTERHVSERDVNGRLVPIIVEREEMLEK